MWAAIIAFLAAITEAIRAWSSADKTRADELQRDLDQSEDDRRRLEAANAAQDAEIERLRDEVERNTRPGDVAGWWDRRVRNDEGDGT